MHLYRASLEDPYVLVQCHPEAQVGFIYVNEHVRQTDTRVSYCL